MSEEILKALTRLFAIITKQDGGVTDKERLYVIHFFQTELDHDTIESYVQLYDEYSGYGNGKDDEAAKARLTSVKDSVKTLGICKKINQTLTQKQKVVVLIKLLELVASGNNFSPQRKEIINTISSVFNLHRNEYNAVEKFVISRDFSDPALKEILLVSNTAPSTEESFRHVHTHINGTLIFLRVRSVDMYFAK